MYMNTEGNNKTNYLIIIITILTSNVYGGGRIPAAAATNCADCIVGVSKVRRWL